MARAFNVESEYSKLSLLPITRQRIVALARHFDEASASAVVDMAIEQMWQREMGEPERDVYAEIDELRQQVAMIRGTTKMIAVEIKLDTGTFYIPLQTDDRGSVLLPMDGGLRVLKPRDIRTSWNAWVSDEVADHQLLTADELAQHYPNIGIDREA